MPSTYTQNLGIEQPATGEQANTWGITVNRNMDTLDTAINGNTSLQLSSSPYPLTIDNGADSPVAANPVIIWNGPQSLQSTVQIDWQSSRKHLYIMSNQTSGGFGIAFAQGTGTQFVLQAGYDAVIYSDGGGVGANVAQALANPQFGNMLLTGSLAAQGSLTVAGSLTIQTGTGNKLVLQGGAWAQFNPANNAWDFEIAASQTSQGYALQFGSASFTYTGLAMNNGGQVGVGTNVPTTTLDIRPAGAVVQVTGPLDAIVSGSMNGGAIYFGIDVATGIINPTAAIETSWGSANNDPMLGIGVIRGGLKANILMDYGSNTEIRAGGTTVLMVTGAGAVGVMTTAPQAMFHVVGGRSRFSAAGEPYSICLEYALGSGVAVIYLGTDASGEFQIANQAGGVLMRSDQSGNFQIAGTLTTGGGLTINGQIHSTSGGIMFPDGTVQTTAIANTFQNITVNGIIYGPSNWGGVLSACPPTLAEGVGPNLPLNTIGLFVQQTSGQLFWWWRKFDGTLWYEILSQNFNQWTGPVV